MAAGFRFLAFLDKHFNIEGPEDDEFTEIIFAWLMCPFLVTIVALGRSLNERNDKYTR